jgi:hypothetical protein
MKEKTRDGGKCDSEAEKRQKKGQEKDGERMERK